MQTPGRVDPAGRLLPGAQTPVLSSPTDRYFGPSVYSASMTSSLLPPSPPSEPGVWAWFSVEADEAAWYSDSAILWEAFCRRSWAGTPTTTVTVEDLVRYLATPRNQSPPAKNRIPNAVLN